MGHAAVGQCGKLDTLILHVAIYELGLTVTTPICQTASLRGGLALVVVCRVLVLRFEVRK